MNPRRVAITGCGVVSPLGTGMTAFRDALLAGRSGIGLLPRELTERAGVQVGGVAPWDPSAHFKPAEAGQLDRASQFAVVAAAEAITSSGLDPAASDSTRIGVCWGTGMGGPGTIEQAYLQMFARNDYRLRPMTVVMGMNNAPGSNVALRWGLQGPFANYSTACSSSAMAIGEAMSFIRHGRAAAMIAGGAEALLVTGVLAAWNAVRALAPADAEHPEASCKPFDRRRAGLVLAEGAAAVVLEEGEAALARGARVLGWLDGYGNSNDGVHLSRPDKAGQVRAMSGALQDAGCAPEEIGYINAHGTATLVGDVVECEAIREVFGAETNGIPVSSTKSMHGHLMGGAGAIEFIAALMPLADGWIPPTAHLEDPDPACAVRHVARTAVKVTPPRAVLSNSFGFGGSNVVLVARR